MDVFLVHHVHVYDDGEEDVKFIGVYSTRESAERRRNSPERSPSPLSSEHQLKYKPIL
jgi:hypothetical protein